MDSPRLTPEEVRHIALLYRMGLDEQEVERLRNQLSDILANFRVLQEVDTADVPPTGHSVELQNVMRDDDTAPPMPTDDTLANAPYREDDFFRVKAVLD